MRKYFLASSVFLPFVAGCLAYGSESLAEHGAVDLSLGSLVIIYGPMAGMLAWFMWREKVREDKADKRDKDLQDVIAKSTAATTLATVAIAEMRADMQKNRTAVYQLRDDVRGTTRVMRTDDEE